MDERKIEEEVYGGAMPAHNKAVLRAMKEREDRRWGEFCERDFISGFDDGEARP